MNYTIDENKIVVKLPFTERNFKLYTEDYFRQLDMNVKVSIVISNDKLTQNGGESIESISIPYRYFHYNIKYLSDKIFQKNDGVDETKNESIFIESLKGMPIRMKKMRDKIGKYFENVPKTEGNTKGVNNNMLQPTIISYPVVQHESEPKTMIPPPPTVENEHNEITTPFSKIKPDQNDNDVLMDEKTKDILFDDLDKKSIKIEIFTGKEMIVIEKIHSYKELEKLYIAWEEDCKKVGLRENVEENKVIFFRNGVGFGLGEYMKNIHHNRWMGTYVSKKCLLYNESKKGDL